VKENYLPESFVGFWALVGMSAAVKLRVPQDYGLVAAGVIGTVLVVIESRKAERLARHTTPADAQKAARR